jgi:competence protein ComEA
MRSRAFADRRFGWLAAASALLAILCLIRPQWSQPPVQVTAIAVGPSAGAFLVDDGVSGKRWVEDRWLAARQVDLNHATVGDLDEIPGLGPTMAAAVIAERARGPFRDLADLDRRVPRLSPAALDAVATFGMFERPYLDEVVPTPTQKQARRSPARAHARPRGVASTPSDRRLRANSASSLEWERLPGVGPSLASRIVLDRSANGPFHSVDDLARVSGIGPKLVEKLRPWLVID